jgi:uncharacterized RDD family membrane protein YckC
MPWYYAEDAAQQGPVADEQFADLVRLGKVRADTLVWREGMANWQPYSTVAGPATSDVPPVFTSTPTSAPAGANEVVCHECGTIVPKENAIQYGSIWVCANCKPMFVQKLREGARVPIVAAGQLDYAGFWIRFGAKLIDNLILGVVLVVPFVVIMFLVMSRSLASRSVGAAATGPDPILQVMLQLGFQFGYLGVSVAYSTFFHGKYGATPGKMACGLRVVMSDSTKISYGRAFGRGMAELLSNMLCYIGYIIAAFDDQKRALHDHMCDTRVVRK